jgi:CRP-like cAMP-binding protein
MIGILDGLLERPYTRTAVAVTHCRTIALAMEDYFDTLEDNFEYTRAMIVYGAARHDELTMSHVPDAAFNQSEVTTPDSPLALDAATLNIIERLLALRATRFVRSAPVQALASLAHLASQRSFVAGEPLFRAGDGADDLHVLVAGKVRVRREKPKVNALFLPVRLVAGLATLGFDQHRYEAVAETDVTTLSIAKEDLFDVAEDHFGLARALFAYSSLERERVMALRQERASLRAPGVRAGAPA